MKTKIRTHREWFRPVSLGNRKSCPDCKAKLPFGESIWTWFEYHIAKQRKVQNFCRQCWEPIRLQLVDHAGPCGCTIELVGYHCKLPNWLTLGEQTCPA